MQVKCIASLDDAIAHINRHGSHHTDAIVSDDAAAIDRFFARVDSAGTYANASTRFADGQRYGFGAEVGVSTNRIHARGPVGLEGLLTVKYRLYGAGHVASDYGAGKSAFTHRPLPLALPESSVSGRVGRLVRGLGPVCAAGVLAAACGVLLGMRLAARRHG